MHWIYLPCAVCGYERAQRGGVAGGVASLRPRADLQRKDGTLALRRCLNSKPRPFMHCHRGIRVRARKPAPPIFCSPPDPSQDSSIEILDQLRTKFEERSIKLVVCSSDHMEPQGGKRPHTMSYNCLMSSSPLQLVMVQTVP